MLGPDVGENAIEVIEFIDAGASGDEDAVGQAVHGHLEACRVAFPHHGGNPCRFDAGVKFDAVDLGRSGLPHCGKGVTGVIYRARDQGVSRGCSI